ncbi:MAG TPA: cation:proton antiporter [Beijerinckiaceae bacterium]|nr:cation:proton antiporter [Beijerinckiaceae bacterium]
MKRISCAGAVCLTLASSAALAADSQGQGGSATQGMAEALLVGQLLLLLVVGRGLGELMQRFGQPAVIGQLVGGLLLGPSLFGWIWPQGYHFVFPNTAEQKSLLSGIADIGVLMLLLVTGMELDLKLASRIGKPAVTVAAMGVAVPFACGFALGQFLPDSLLPGGRERLVSALFLGTALSISSIKIVAMVVRDMNFMRRDLGQIIVASAIIEDTVGWIIIAVTLGIAGAGNIAAGSIGWILVSTALFLVASYTVGRTLAFKLIRWVNDHLVSEDMVITATLVLMLALALITQAIGVNTVLGAFVAGVLVGESPIMSSEIEERLRGFITAFLMPVFFGLSGLGADLTILKNPTMILATAGLVLVASVGKFCGAFSGGWLGGLSRKQSLALGCAMNARGSTEVIVATIGLSMGALTQNLYTMILAMAVITTMAMPPMLRWALGRLPLERAEEERLKKEEIDEAGFVNKLERLLVVADMSANGKFATRLAGFLAGERGRPMTLLRLQSNPASESEDAKGDRLAEAALDSAETASKVSKPGEEGERHQGVEIIRRDVTNGVAEVVSEEAEKGFDLLFIGIEAMQGDNGVFSDEVNRIVSGFKGPVVLAREGSKTAPMQDRDFDMVVAVNGTEASRRGAELGFALVPPKNTTVRALHIPEREVTEDASGRRRDRWKTERAILDDVTELGQRYGFDVKTRIRRHASAAEAILQEAFGTKANLVVIGAQRRIGKTLFLGRTVTALLESWPGSLVVLAN